MPQGKKSRISTLDSVDSELIGGEDKQIQISKHAARSAPWRCQSACEKLVHAESLTEKHSQPTIVTGYQLEKWPMAI